MSGCEEMDPVSSDADTIFFMIVNSYGRELTFGYIDGVRIAY